jgi:hypothetical protein
MAFPKSAPTASLISSRQLVPGSLINDMNNAQYSYQLIIALGVAQVDAALGDAANIEIASGSANNAGLKLPPAFPGATISILNNSLNTTVIYGNGTDTIQTTGTTYAASITMATLVNITLHCIKAGFWQRVITA